MRVVQTAITIPLITLLVASSVAQPARQHIRIPIRLTLDSLVYDEDTDGDKRITIDDPHIIGTSRGDKSFWLTTLDRHQEEVSGAYYLSNLLQELKLAEESHLDTAELAGARIFERPVDRISRSIRDPYWDGLTRSVDENGLGTILSDEKNVTIDGFGYICVPPSHKLAYEYFNQVSKRHPDWNMKVVPSAGEDYGTIRQNCTVAIGITSADQFRTPASACAAHVARWRLSASRIYNYSTFATKGNMSVVVQYRILFLDQSHIRV